MLVQQSVLLLLACIGHGVQAQVLDGLYAMASMPDNPEIPLFQMGLECNDRSLFAWGVFGPFTNVTLGFNAGEGTTLPDGGHGSRAHSGYLTRMTAEGAVEWATNVTALDGYIWGNTLRLSTDQTGVIVSGEKTKPFLHGVCGDTTPGMQGFYARFRADTGECEWLVQHPSNGQVTLDVRDTLMDDAGYVVFGDVLALQSQPVQFGANTIEQPFHGGTNTVFGVIHATGSFLGAAGFNASSLADLNVVLGGSSGGVSPRMARVSNVPGVSMRFLATGTYTTKFDLNFADGQCAPPEPIADGNATTLMWLLDATITYQPFSLTCHSLHVARQNSPVGENIGSMMVAYANGRAYVAGRYRAGQFQFLGYEPSAAAMALSPTSTFGFLLVLNPLTGVVQQSAEFVLNDPSGKVYFASMSVVHNVATDSDDVFVGGFFTSESEDRFHVVGLTPPDVSDMRYAYAPGAEVQANYIVKLHVQHALPAISMTWYVMGFPTQTDPNRPFAAVLQTLNTGCRFTAAHPPRAPGLLATGTLRTTTRFETPTRNASLQLGLESAIFLLELDTEYLPFSSSSAAPLVAPSSSVDSSSADSSSADSSSADSSSADSSSGGSSSVAGPSSSSSSSSDEAPAPLASSSSSSSSEETQPPPESSSSSSSEETQPPPESSSSSTGDGTVEEPSSSTADEAPPSSSPPRSSSVAPLPSSSSSSRFSSTGEPASGGGSSDSIIPIAAGAGGGALLLLLLCLLCTRQRRIRQKVQRDRDNLNTAVKPETHALSSSSHSPRGHHAPHAPSDMIALTMASAKQDTVGLTPLDVAGTLAGTMTELEDAPINTRPASPTIS